MSRTFTKLFSSITESTVWCEPDRTRLVWIAMLAMADHAGRVWSSVPGLANRARVPLEDVEIALTTFLSPDSYSRTPDHEGRRIEPIDGGWRLLNHAKYRQIRDEESIKESKRRYISERRAAEKAASVEKSRTESNAVDRGRANAEAEAEAEDTPPERVTTPPASPERVGSFEGHADPVHTPSPAAAHSIALRAEGFPCTPMNPHLVAFVEAGGTVAHLQAVMALPDCAGKGAGYVIKIARRELAERVQPIAQGGSHESPRKLSASEQTRDAIARRRRAESADAGR